MHHGRSSGSHGSLTKGCLGLTLTRGFIKEEGFKVTLSKERVSTFPHWVMIPQERSSLRQLPSVLLFETVGTISRPAFCDRGVLVG